MKVSQRWMLCYGGNKRECHTVHHHTLQEYGAAYSLVKYKIAKKESMKSMCKGIMVEASPSSHNFPSFSQLPIFCSYILHTPMCLSHARKMSTKSNGKKDTYQRRHLLLERFCTIFGLVNNHYT